MSQNRLHETIMYIIARIHGFRNHAAQSSILFFFYSPRPKFLYAKCTFSMFGGEPETVAMVFQNRMMEAVMDRFGNDIVAMKKALQDIAGRYE